MTRIVPRMLKIIQVLPPRKPSHHLLPEHRLGLMPDFSLLTCVPNPAGDRPDQPGAPVCLAPKQQDRLR
jgi:hypothetical protein